MYKQQIEQDKVNKTIAQWSYYEELTKAAQRKRDNELMSKQRARMENKSLTEWWNHQEDLSRGVRDRKANEKRLLAGIYNQQMSAEKQRRENDFRMNWAEEQKMLDQLRPFDQKEMIWLK